MAIIARISDPVTVTPDFGILVRVQFFDDADPLNTGVGTLAPRVILQTAAFPYPATLTGTELQQAVRADIQAKGATFKRAHDAAVSASTLVPVGALVAVS